MQDYKIVIRNVESLTLSKVVMLKGVKLLRVQTSMKFQKYKRKENRLYVKIIEEDRFYSLQTNFNREGYSSITIRKNFQQNN